MKLPFLSLFNVKSQKYLLGLDLGTTEIKAAIFKTPKNTEEASEIVGKGSQKLGQSDFRGSSPMDVDSILEASRLAIHQAQIQAKAKPSSGYILNSGLILAAGTLCKLERPSPEKLITEKEMEGLFPKIKERVLKVTQEKIASMLEIPSSQLQHLEMEVLGFTLDQKKVDSPLELPGENLTLSLVNTFISNQELKSLNLIAQQLGLRPLGFKSNLVLVSEWIKEKYPEGILVDIGGKITELGVFKTNGFGETNSFNLGSYHLSQMLAEALDLSWEQCERIKRAFSENKLNPEKSQAVKETAKEWTDILLKGLKVGLEEMAKKQPLPDKFLIYGGGSLVPTLHSSFIAHPWNRILPFSSFPKPVFLSEETSENTRYLPLISLANTYQP